MTEQSHQPEGLTQEQNFEATRLYLGRKLSEANRAALRSNRKGLDPIDKLLTIAHPVGVIKDVIGEVRNARHAERYRKASQVHYEANTQAYHNQALQEAEKAGKTINFSSTVAEKVKVQRPKVPERIYRTSIDPRPVDYSHTREETDRIIGESRDH